MVPCGLQEGLAALHSPTVLMETIGYSPQMETVLWVMYIQLPVAVFFPMLAQIKSPSMSDPMQPLLLVVVQETPSREQGL